MDNWLGGREGHQKVGRPREPWLIRKMNKILNRNRTQLKEMGEGVNMTEIQCMKFSKNSLKYVFAVTCLISYKSILTAIANTRSAL